MNDEERIEKIVSMRKQRFFTREVEIHKMIGFIDEESEQRRCSELKGLKSFRKFVEERLWGSWYELH